MHRDATGVDIRWLVRIMHEYGTWNSRERVVRVPSTTTRPGSETGKPKPPRPKNYLCKTSPHGGTSDDVGALLGLVLVHVLLGLGGFGLGGHLVLDVVVRHGLLLAAGFLWRRHEVYRFEVLVAVE